MELMRVDGFEWDENNVVKNILNHDTYPDEIEDSFYNRYKLRRAFQQRYLLYGVTDVGRYLFVMFVMKKQAKKNLVRVISARDMTKKERQYYLRQK
jgi:uncharacterized DUF497 family protein